MASQIDLGAVVPIGKGDWNASTTYERTNIVRHNSTAWMCKVAISTGVEPTESSSDWYLLVKDTNSVTSVNGMKGDVIVDTSTADKLTTARKITLTGPITGTANFDGSTNINIPTTIVEASTDTKGIVQLSSDVNSTSTTIAATSKAVKVAYDKAVEAKNTADAAASSIDPWNIFPMRVPIVVDGVTFGGSDGRRAIMPGESVARENWILCDGGSDGKGGTVPDLRGRMILGASSTYTAGSTGGSATHTHSISGTVGATTLTTNEMPKHSHSFTAVNDDENGQTSDIMFGRRGGRSTRSVRETGGSQSHTHSLSNTSTTEETLLPPYYSLSYIIKIS